VVIPDNVRDPEAPAISARRDERRGGKDRNHGARKERGGRNGGSGSYNKKPYNRGGRSGGRSSSSASGTTLKNNDFFGTFLGNSKDN
jgi:hypothetical protein